MTTPDRIPQTDPAGVRELAAAGALLLDVREQGEWSAGHIEGAVHVPLGSLDPASFSGERTVVAICRSGNRSGTAAVALADAGVDVHNMAGGMRAWAEAGYPFVDDRGEQGTVA